MTGARSADARAFGLSPEKQGTCSFVTRAQENFSSLDPELVRLVTAGVSLPRGGNLVILVFAIDKRAFPLPRVVNKPSSPLLDHYAGLDERE